MSDVLGKLRHSFWGKAQVIVCCMVLSAGLANAQDKAPDLDEAASKAVDAVEDDFDEALKDLGELAGEVYACEADDAKRASHEDRVRDIYGELNKLFGTDRAFLFSTAVGYGAASENDQKTCVELTDEFEDRYGAISEKYDLID